MKEYLTKNKEGGYSLVNHRFGHEDIEVPEGAEYLINIINGSPRTPEMFFRNSERGFQVFGDEWEEAAYSCAQDYVNDGDVILWQRNPIDIDKISYERGSSLSVDNVNHPSHYASGAIECIDAIKAGMSEEMFEGYLKGCCNKYLWRYKIKGGSESLRKAEWYLKRLIDLNEEIESRNK